MIAIDTRELAAEIAVELAKHLEGQDGTPWMTYPEAAEYLHVSERKLRHLVALKEVPHRRLDGRVLFNRRELDQYVSSLEGVSA